MASQSEWTQACIAKVASPESPVFCPYCPTTELTCIDARVSGSDVVSRIIRCPSCGRHGDARMRHPE